MALESDDKVVRNALIENSLEFAFGLGFVLVEHYYSHPTEWRLFKMRLLARAHKFAARRTEFWWDQTLKWAIAYNKERVP